MRYLAYRVVDGHGSPGAVVCRRFTREEALAAGQSPVVCRLAEPFDAATSVEAWQRAYAALGIREAS